MIRIILCLLLFSDSLKAQNIYSYDTFIKEIGTEIRQINNQNKGFINIKKEGYLIDTDFYYFYQDKRIAATDTCCEYYVDNVIKISSYSINPNYCKIQTKFKDNRLVFCKIQDKLGQTFYYYNIKPLGIPLKY